MSAPRDPRSQTTDATDATDAIEPDAIRWQWTPWSALDRDTLYTLLRLRAEVFVVEQQCLYLDLDGHDPAAWHLLGWHGDRLAACARVFPAGHKAPEHAIGRVVTAPFARGSGLGRPLMREAIRRAEAEFGPGPSRVEAQAHLAGYYGSLGYRQVGGIYDEDGIPHITMIRPG